MSLIAGAADLIGSGISSALNAREAQKQRHFQKKMFKKRYQFTVQDMRAAGLNPMLAYQQGGGSAPSGAMAKHDIDVGGAVGTALAAKLQKKQRNLIDQQEAESRSREAANWQSEQKLAKETEGAMWNSRSAELEYKRLGFALPEWSAKSAMWRRGGEPLAWLHSGSGTARNLMRLIPGAGKLNIGGPFK